MQVHEIQDRNDRGTGLDWILQTEMVLAPHFRAPMFTLSLKNIWKLHHSRTYTELRYKFFGFLDVHQLFQDFPLFFVPKRNGSTEAPLARRPGWRTVGSRHAGSGAFGGERGEAVQRPGAAARSIEEHRGTLKSRAVSGEVSGWSAIGVCFFLEILGTWIKCKVLIQGLSRDCCCRSGFLIFCWWREMNSSFLMFLLGVHGSLKILKLQDDFIRGCTIRKWRQ